MVPYPYTLANNFLNLISLEILDVTKFDANLLLANIYEITGERVKPGVCKYLQYYCFPF